MNIDIQQNNEEYNFIRCIASTVKSQQCKHFTNPHTEMFCKIHRSSIPQYIFYKNIKIVRIRKDEYIYLDNKTKNMKELNNNIIKELLKEYNNQIEFDNRIKNEEKKRKINDILTCKCCYSEDFLDEQLLRCDKITYDNAHKICVDCIIANIDIQLKDNKVSLNCLFDSSDNCGGVYDIQTLKAFMSEEQYERYYDLFLINEAKELAKTIDNYQICPNCVKYGVEIDINTNEKIDVKCNRCEKYWCNLCRKPSHNDHCYVIKFDSKINDKDKIIIIDNLINDIISKKLIHICPHCESSFIKIDGDGCNLMTCTNCKGHSCYICGIKIFVKFGSYYYHFKGHALNDGSSTCPLWNGNMTDSIRNGNIRYNNDKIIKEFDILLDVNKDINIRKMIYNRMKSIVSNLQLIIQLGKKYKLEDSCIIL